MSTAVLEILFKLLAKMYYCEFRGLRLIWQSIEVVNQASSVRVSLATKSLSVI